MAELSERQKLVLALVIHDYIETAQPVGSARLVEHFGLDVSTATVRNELAFLTDAGFLRQPHTSAGRVPTEEGYRYFVRQLMGHIDLPAPTKQTITHQFYQAGNDVDHWMRLAASVLAHQSQGAALVTAPHPDRYRFKHIELIATHGSQVLMVAVFATGEVRQQMLALAEHVPQDQLSAAANRINELFQGMDAHAMLAQNVQLTELEKDVTKLLRAEMEQSNSLIAGEIYRDGLTNFLAEPEFAEAAAARRALRVLEERSILEDLLRRTISTTDVGGVQVLIGGEGTWEELSDCSVVLARYGNPGLATGTLGVFGPIRMAYGRTISTVRFVAGLLSELVVDTLTE